MEQWYALYTKANAEAKVASILQEQGIETYLPALTSSVNGQEPLFPCYLFMHADLKKLTNSSWQWTPGLRRIVCRDEQPLAIAPEIIHTIKSNICQMSADKNSMQSYQFQPGEEVRILQGPFKDMHAIFTTHMSSNERVRVLLNVLGQQKRIQINVKDLEHTSFDAEAQNKKQQKRLRRTRGKGRRIKYEK